MWGVSPWEGPTTHDKDAPMPRPSRRLVWRAAPLLCAAAVAGALFITGLALAGGTTLPVRLTEYRVAPPRPRSTPAR